MCKRTQPQNKKLTYQLGNLMNIQHYLIHIYIYENLVMATLFHSESICLDTVRELCCICKEIHDVENGSWGCP